MKRFDPITGKLQRIERRAAAGFARGFDLARRHLDPGFVEVEPVELQREILEGAVAARGDVGDNVADGGFDVGGCLAFGIEKRAELLRKIIRAGVETDRHGHDLRAMTDDASKVMFTEAEYQPAIIITILIYPLSD